MPLQRIIVSIGNASYTIAPSIVFMVGFDPNAGVGDWAALTAAAVCAQFVGDGLISMLREYLAVGVDPRALLGPLAWIFFVDASLAPVGFAAGVAGSLWTPAYLLPLPLLLLARFFAKERADRLSHALELSAAYRGTASCWETSSRRTTPTPASTAVTSSSSPLPSQTTSPSMPAHCTSQSSRRSSTTWARSRFRRPSSTRKAR